MATTALKYTDTEHDKSIMINSIINKSNIIKVSQELGDFVYVKTSKKVDGVPLYLEFEEVSENKYEYLGTVSADSVSDWLVGAIEYSTYGDGDHECYGAKYTKAPAEYLEKVFHVREHLEGMAGHRVVRRSVTRRAVSRRPVKRTASRTTKRVVRKIRR